MRSGNSLRILMVGGVMLALTSAGFLLSLNFLVWHQLSKQVPDLLVDSVIWHTPGKLSLTGVSWCDPSGICLRSSELNCQYNLKDLFASKPIEFAIEGMNLDLEVAENGDPSKLPLGRFEAGGAYEMGVEVLIHGVQLKDSFIEARGYGHITATAMNVSITTKLLQLPEQYPVEWKWLKPLMTEKMIGMPLYLAFSGSWKQPNISIKSEYFEFSFGS